MYAVMLDTNIFDRLVEDDGLFTKLPRKNFKYYATDIQYQQICAMPKEKAEKQAKMEIFFYNLVNKIPSITKQYFGFDHSNFYNARFCSKEEAMDLDELHRKKKKNLADALILLTGKYGGNMIIISEDKKFPFNEAKKKGYQVYPLDEFLVSFRDM